ncbi:MAG: hypothetical protein ACFE8B_03870 [Candidatus Hermodarchaeota archaeon]
MVKKLKVKKVFSILYLDARNYVLFSPNYSKHEFLYYKHLEKDIKALLFGENLQKILPEALKNEESKYIEILLDRFILGGLSYNNGELVESYFSKSQANQILSNLKNKIGISSEIIELF